MQQAAVGAAIGRAQQIEVRALRARVAGEHRPVRRQVACHRRVPRLDQSERVVPVDAPVVRGRGGRRREQRILNGQRSGERAGDRFGDVERRLRDASCRAMFAYESAVVGDAVAAADDRASRRPVGHAEARAEVVRVRVDQSRRERAGEQVPMPPASTGATAVKPGAASRFASWPFSFRVRQRRARSADRG